MLKMFRTCNGLHPIFTYIPFKVQMFLTLWKPYVMFPLNSLALFPHLFLLWQCHLWCFMPLLPQLSFSWRCHLWYYNSLYNCLYHCWHCPYHCWYYRWFHSTFHHFLCLQICALVFPLHF
jgi:hypothetical protein